MKWLSMLLLVLPQALQAQEVTVIKAVEPVRELHVFGGTDAPMELTTDIPLGAVIEVRADLWQLAGSLAALLRKDLAVGEKPLDSSGGVPRLLHWSVALLEVQRITRMALRFRVRRMEDASWQPAGSLAFTVYPKDSAQWQGFTRRSDARIAVFGSPNTSLRRALKAHGVKYEDLGMEPPQELPAAVLVIGEMSSASLHDWLESRPGHKGALVVVCPDSDELPVISVNLSPGFCLTKIAAALLENLPTDPRAGKTLVDTLNRALDLAAAR